MSRRHALLTLAATLFCPIPAHAGEKDFWVTKPYVEWTEKEVEKMLTKSPWCKTMTLNLGPMGDRSDSAGGRGAGRGGGGRGRGGEGDVSPSVRAAEVTVIWYSQPVRHAMARGVMLRNPEATAKDLDQFLKYPETPSITILIADWISGIREDSEEAFEKFKKDTYLEKKNGERIAPEEVVLPKRRGHPLLLRFPKESGGKPLLSLEDLEVSLVTRVGQLRIKAKFRLAELVVRDHLAL